MALNEPQNDTQHSQDVSQHDAGHAPVTDPAHLLPAHATPDAQPARKSPWRTVIVVLVLLAIVGLIAWRIHSSHAETAANASKAAAAANRPIPVQTTPVQLKTIPIYLTALGTVTPYNTVTLHTRVDGQLLQVNFREGQEVKQGQLLLQIDPRPYQAAVDQALGTLAKDEANLKNEEAEAQRYTALYQAGVVSKESQQSQVSNAGQAQGSIKADQAAIEAAKVNLGYTRIYSPINGTVGLRQVDPGNIVHAADSTGLVVITQVHPIAIIFTLPEDQLPQVQQAMRGGTKLVAEAYDRSDAHKIASGTLLTIDNEIDTTTGTAKLKAVFDNKDSALFSNQFVNVRLVLNERQNAVVVPTAAIESGTQGTYVFVVRNGPTPANKRQNASGGAAAASGGKHAKTAGATSTDGSSSSDASKSQPKYHVDMVPVAVDLTQGSNTILKPGAVNNGDQVVIDGQEKLVDGSNVTAQVAKPTGGTGQGNASDTLGPSTTGSPAPNSQHGTGASSSSTPQ